MRRMKRLYSFLLALALVLSLLPALPVFATSYQLWIAGTQVTDSNYGNVLGDGAFYYDASGSTLYVYGDCNSSETIIRSEIPGLTIFIANDVSFYGNGQYVMELAADTVVTGHSTLDISADTDGINVTGSATLEFDHENVYLYANGRGLNGAGTMPKLKVTCSDVYVYSYTSAAVGYFTGGITLDQARITLPEGYQIIEGCVVGSDGMTLADEVRIEKNETYDIRIAGVPVTDENKHDILGDGCFRFDEDGVTLTISGDCTTGDSVLYSSMMYLKIYVEKDAVLTSNWSSAIYLYGDAMITGPGKLTAVGGDSACGIFVSNNGFLTLQDANVVARGGYGISGGSNEYLAIYYSDVWADGPYGAICDFADIAFDYSWIVDPDGGFSDGNQIVDAANHPATHVVIEASPPIVIDGVFVTKDNWNDILGNGVFSYDPETKTLFIDGDYTATTDCMVRSLQNGLTVETLSNTMLTATITDASCFELLGDTTFTGTGQLNIEADYCGIYAINDADVTIENATVVSEANDYAITGSYYNELRVIGSNVFAQVTSSYGAISDFGSIELERELLRSPADGIIKDNAVYESDGTTKADMVYLLRHYGLKVAGEWITDLNCADILMDGGSVVYYPLSNLLYLDNDIVCADDAVESSNPGLTIWVNRDLTLNSTDYSALELSADTLIAGAGELTLQGSFCGLIASANAAITLSNLTVNATGQYGITGSWNEHLVVDHANVTAYGSTYGAICDFQDITLKHCYLRKPVGGKISGGDVLYSDDNVAHEAEIKTVPLYDLMVAGEYVSDTNKDDILGDGAFRYDDSTRTLTVSGDCTTDQTLIWSHIDGLTVDVAADVTLECTNYAYDAIAFEADTTLRGSGKLTLKAKSRGVFIDNGALLTIEDATMDLSGKYGFAGTGYEYIRINNSNVSVDVSEEAFWGFVNVELYGCALVKPVGGYVIAGTVYNADDTVASTVVINCAETYELWIKGTQVDSLNAADVLGDSVFSFDPSTNTLTVDGFADVYGTTPVVTSSIAGLTIYVKADTIMISENAPTLWLANYTTITGPGLLSLASADKCIFVSAPVALSIRDAKLKATTEYPGCIGGDSSGQTLIVEHSQVHATAKITAIGGFNGGITLTDCVIEYPADGKIGTHNIVYANDAPAEEVVIDYPSAPTYHTVTFNANGHGTAPVAQTVESGATATEPTAPTETGWTFGGWYTEAECVNKYNFSTPVTADITLYAKWTENTTPPPTTYTVSFDANGHGTAPAAITVPAGAPAPEPADDPTETGWTFCGWYTEPECTNKYDFSTPVTADVTLYAKWVEGTIVTSYTVTFDGNGVGPAPAPQGVEPGHTAIEPEAPGMEGWTFCGWYTEPECVNKYDFSTPVTADITLYAKWVRVNPFTDVHESEYWYDAVLWAYYHTPFQITNGTSATTFGPNKNCTRAQIVTFLWRAKGCPEPSMSGNPFSDVDESAYYYKAVLWAVEKGITTGTGAGKFSPDKPCTRGQAVTFLWRAEGKPAPAKTDNPFQDVKPDDYFYDAVLWAFYHTPLITNGTSANQFSPNRTCIRGQIVTFLYRDLAG